MDSNNKIASFQVDHTTLCEGIYLSQTNGDIQTYDVRLVKPNGGKYIQYGAIHTIEHLLATFARNSEFKDSVIYVGPMGCRTGFYLLVRDLPQKDVIKLVQGGIAFVADFEGKIPGRTAKECGNYIEHDLRRAKRYCTAMKDTIANWTVEKLKY